MKGPGGHIRDRVGADGKRRYAVVFELEADPATGKRRTVSGGTFRTKREAQEKLAEGIVEGPAVKAKGTLGEFLAEEWLPSKNRLAPATRLQYEWACEHITKRIGAVRLSALTPRHVQEFNEQLRVAGLSSRSQQIMGKSLRNALSMAVQRRYLQRSPADGVPIATGQRISEINFWTSREAQTFLSHPDVLADRLRPCWFFALSTGLRRGELCALRWQDVNLAGKRITVRQAARIDGYAVSVGPPKTKAAVRTVGLNAETVRVLTEWTDAQRDELARVGVKPTFVFSEADGTMIHPQTLALRFTAVSERAEMKVIGLHGLRHTHATLALEAGVPLKVLSERLGHGSIQITADTYQHATEHLQHDAAEAIGALLGS